MIDNPVIIIMAGEKPRELKFDFAIMAKTEAVVNTAEGRKPDDLVDFTTIINDRKRLSMDRFRILFWCGLYGALTDHERGKFKLSDVDAIYTAYANAYQPVEEEQTGNDGKQYLVTIGAKANLLNKLTEAVNVFLGPPSQVRVKEEMEETENLSLGEKPLNSEPESSDSSPETSGD